MPNDPVAEARDELENGHEPRHRTDPSGCGGGGRMSGFDRRAYSREYAARRRAERLAEARSGATTCPRRNGPGRCGGLLETIVLAGGATGVRCPRCDRRERGLCVDCARPVQGQKGKALRCVECKALARQGYCRRYAVRNRERLRARGRRAYQQNEAERQRRNDYKKRWRKENRLKVYAQKRRARLAGKTNGYATREKYLAYQKAYRAKYRERRAAQERERYHASQGGAS